MKIFRICGISARIFASMRFGHVLDLAPRSSVGTNAIFIARTTSRPGRGAS